ncbi:CDP-alcohol phosphatidyltransferase family protein [Actinoplanes sp. NPDC049316]|uniref:CDP-alcohol phosphatidyltransferase family protein n=1 Tax=Actinoplanes sp. NPDC049316 TaxID=3154727 RepID=UPI00342EFB79
MTWEQYAVAWSALHGGFDPRTASPVVRGWIRLAYRGGGLLARLGAGPSAVTTVGLLLCAGVPFVPLLAGAVLVLLASFADAFDGAVAVISGKASRLGFVYDSVADRLGELAWLAAFWVAGVPGWLVVAALAVSWLHEYVRARAAAGGMSGLGAVTVGERPTRVSVAISALVVGGVAGLVHPGWDRTVVVIAAIVWVALGVIGLVQLLAAVRRALID